MIDGSTRRQRGASLTEYALIMAVFVAVLIGVVQVLTDNGGALLNETESGIATPRPFSDAVVQTPVSAAPPWAATTTAPSSLLTYVEKPVQLPGGECLALSGGLISSDTCGGPDELVVSGLSEDGTHLTLYLGNGGTTCLTGVTTTSPAEVVSSPCGAGGQVWTQVSVSGLDVVYRHVESGLCLAEAVAAPPPTTTTTTTVPPSTSSTAPGATTTTVPTTTTTTAPPTPTGALTLAACSGAADQIFGVLY
ncbi:MAG: hypothetical protein AAF962_07370 [Actinomycetota bacterium]